MRARPANFAYMGGRRSIEGRGWRFEATPDRAGLALGAGGVMGGLVWLVASLGGGGGWLAASTAFVLGALFSAFAIAGVAGPLWLALHIAGWRGMHHAAILGAVLGFCVFLFVQTHGLGLDETAPADLATQLYRWASAAAVSALLAAIAAVIAVVMWAVAYRRID